MTDNSITKTITIELVQTNFFTRHPCTVCGGCTEKVAILAEGKGHFFDDTSSIIRVCETCLCEQESGGIDASLDLRARALEAEAERLRDLIGRLKVPTFAEWCKAEREHEVQWFMHTYDLTPEQAESKVHPDYPREQDRPLLDFDDEELPF